MTTLEVTQTVVEHAIDAMYAVGVRSLGAKPVPTRVRLEAPVMGPFSP